MTATGSPAAPALSPSVAPLSVAQEALWYRAFLDPTALTYNEAISFRRDGPLDVEALRSAFNAIVDRHEAWHTTFDTIDGEPVQIVGPAPRYELPILDLSALTSEQAERRAVQVVAEVARVPYDVRHGPLLRPMLIRFSAAHHRLYLAMHHLIFDGGSLTRTVLPELAAAYRAFSTGGPDPFTEPPVRYTDFARWEQTRIDEPRLTRRLAHWRRRLGSAPALCLAHDRPRPPAPAFRGGTLGLTVPPDTVRRLGEVGREAGATLFQVLAAGWSLLLARHAGQDDVVFAVATDLRGRPEFQSLVGCAITPLALRIDLSGDPSFAELVLRARNELLDGLDNLVAFERVVRALHPDETGANPIYQTMLVLEPAAVTPDPAWSVHQIDAGLADAVGATKLDLELQLDERPDGGLSGRLIYDRDLFDRVTAERFGSHWLALLSEAAADPRAPIGRLTMLTDAERQRQLVEWTATRTVFPRSQTVHELIAAQSRRRPQAIALGAGERAIDYAELERRAQDLADAGLMPAAADEPNGGEPSLGGVVRSLAAMKGGDLLRLPAARGRAVDIGHAAAVNLATTLAGRVGIGPADTVLILPAAVASDPASGVWTALIAGARVLLADPALAGDGPALRSLITAEGVTLLQATPDEWGAVIDSGMRSVRGLRALCCGATTLTRELADAILTRCRVLWRAWGMAETSGTCTLGQVHDEGPVTIGRPVANTRAYVLDPNGRPAPIGAPGRLLIAGEGVAGGYVDGTDERFITDPFAPGRAFRTGLRVRWRADGRLEPVPDH